MIPATKKSPAEYERSASASIHPLPSKVPPPAVAFDPDSRQASAPQPEQAPDEVHSSPVPAPHPAVAGQRQRVGIDPRWPQWVMQGIERVIHAIRIPGHRRHRHIELPQWVPRNNPFLSLGIVRSKSKCRLKKSPRTARSTKFWVNGNTNDAAMAAPKSGPTSASALMVGSKF